MHLVGFTIERSLFGCNRAIIQSTLLEEYSISSFLISASIGGISGNCIPPIFYAFTLKHLRLVTFSL